MIDISFLFIKNLFILITYYYLSMKCTLVINTAPFGQETGTTNAAFLSPHIYQNSNELHCYLLLKRINHKKLIDIKRGIKI